MQEHQTSKKKENSTKSFMDDTPCGQAVLFIYHASVNSYQANVRRRLCLQKWRHSLVEIIDKNKFLSW